MCCVTNSLRLQRRTVALLSAAQVFSGIGAGAVVSTGSLLAVDLSGSEAWAGSAATATTLGAAFGSALLARLVPSGGRRRALTTGLLVAFCGSLVVIAAAVLGAFPLLLAGAALIGFATSANLQARFAATDLSRPGRRGRDLSLVVWMTTVGSVAGPNLLGPGERLSAALGVPVLAGLFVIAAAGLLLGMAVLWWGLKPDPYLTARRLRQEAQEAAGQSGPGGRPAPAPESLVPGSSGRVASAEGTGDAGTGEPAEGAQVTAAAEHAEAAGLKAGLSALMRSSTGRRAFIGVLTAHAVMVAVMSMTPVHMSGHGAAITLVGLTVSLHIAGMYALAPVMGMLADRLGARAVLAGGQVILLAAAVLAGLSGHAHTLTMAGLVLLGLGWSAATVAGSSMLVVAVPASARVAAQGTLDTFMSLAGAAGGALAGVVLALVGFTGLGFTAAAVCLVALLAVGLGRPARPHG
ncbi:MFS transporter [Sediminivirga luteola]